MIKAKLIVVTLLCLAWPIIVWAGGGTQPYAETPIEYQPLSTLATDVAGIAVATGLLFFLIRKALPEAARIWYFDQHPWLVNLSVIVVSVGLAVLGAWLNALGFEPRSIIEYIWLGLFSAAVATLGYEFSKNLGRNGTPGR